MPWTNISKPQETSVLNLTGGVPIGLLIAITGTTEGTSITTGWTGTAKPTSSVWTSVTKPTSSVWTFVAKPT